MICRSKSNVVVSLAAFVMALMVCGCSTDVGVANTTKVDTTEALKKQEGQGGIKAARGGGMDEGIIPAPAGVQTGPMSGGGSKTK